MSKEMKKALVVCLLFVCTAVTALSMSLAPGESTEDRVFAEMLSTVPPALASQIKQGLGVDATCIPKRDLFTEIIPGRTYRLAVYCDVGASGVTYHTLIEVTRFGDDDLYWESNGLQAGVRTESKRR